jgi:hypothetical protein
MRSVFFLAVGFLLGMATMMYTHMGSSSLSTTNEVNASDALTEQESEKSFDPEDLMAEAEIYDQEADQIETEVMRYKRRAAALTTLTDPKGLRRAGLTTAAASKSKAVAELRQLAAHHRAEANRMMAKQPRQ